MIDITTIQPFNIPPDVEVLRTENLQLKQENHNLSKDTQFIIATVIISVIIGGLLAIGFNNKQDEKEK